jgi:hypothetical protein
MSSFILHVGKEASRTDRSNRYFISCTRRRDENSTSLQNHTLTKNIERETKKLVVLELVSSTSRIVAVVLWLRENVPWNPIALHVVRTIACAFGPFFVDADYVLAGLLFCIVSRTEFSLLCASPSKIVAARHQLCTFCRHQGQCAQFVLEKKARKFDLHRFVFACNMYDEEKPERALLQRATLVVATESSGRSCGVLAEKQTRHATYSRICRRKRFCQETSTCRPRL